MLVLLKRTPVKESPFFWFYHLAVVGQRLGACTCREMSHVGLESYWIVKVWGLSDQESFAVLTKFWIYSTRKLCDFVEFVSQDVINFEEIKSFFENSNKIWNKLHYFWFAMVNSRDWCKSHKKIESLFPITLVLWDCIKHLSSALRVAYICQLFNPSVVPHKIDLCRCIKFSHFRKRKFPVLLVFLPVKSFMIKTVFDTSLIPKPYIIPLSRKLECWRNCWVINHPAVSWVCNTMLKENYRRSFFYKFPYSKDAQDVAIFSHHWMIFERETVTADDVLERAIEVVWVNVVQVKRLNVKRIVLLQIWIEMGDEWILCWCILE